MPLFRVGIRLSVAIAALHCCAHADGAVIVTNSESVWTFRCNSDALWVATENFERFEGSFPYLSGSLAGTAWTVVSASGVSTSSGRVTSPLSQSLIINFASPVNGVAGQWGAFDSDGNAHPVIVTAITVDGSRYEGLVIGTGFAGFFSRSPEIVGIELFAGWGEQHTPLIDSLQVAIPTPSVAALLALGGFASRRRRG